MLGKRGRPTDPTLNKRIIAATISEIAERGVRRCSMENIAKECKITKPTIYRRWQTKSMLIEEAVHSIKDDYSSINTNDLESGLKRWLEIVATSLAEFPTNMLAFCNELAQVESEYPHLIEHIRENILNPRRKTLNKLVTNAISKGILRDDVKDIDLLISMCIGVLYSEYSSIKKVNTQTLERIMDVILDLLKKT